MNYEPGSSLSHGIAAAFAAGGAALIILFAAVFGDAWSVVSVSIYSASLILLYGASCVYHMVSHVRAKEWFNRIDHAMIYLLIAGTYTPVCLTILRDSVGWWLFGIVWGLAALGMTIKLTGLRFAEWISTALYIALGWAILPFFDTLRQVTSPDQLFWLFLGGVLYTLGTLFFAMSRKWQWTTWFGAHEIWHVFVIAGSGAHFWFVLSII